MQHFTVTMINGFYHWKGLGIYSEYCSEDGFETEYGAIDDAIAYLQSIDDETEFDPSDFDFDDLAA